MNNWNASLSASFWGWMLGLLFIPPDFLFLFFFFYIPENFHCFFTQLKTRIAVFFFFEISWKYKHWFYIRPVSDMWFTYGSVQKDVYFISLCNFCTFSLNSWISWHQEKYVLFLCKEICYYSFVTFSPSKREFQNCHASRSDEMEQMNWQVK